DHDVDVVDSPFDARRTRARPLTRRREKAKPLAGRVTLPAKVELAAPCPIARQRSDDARNRSRAEYGPAEGDEREERELHPSSMLRAGGGGRGRGAAQRRPG